MIKLHNLNKFYNKGKQNEIHVINDITLEFPQTGLVVLLGESGSGKTTLLNVIGGLDKLNNGVINFDEQEIKRYSPRKWDKIRNDNIGYIFQNYNLLTDLTVYENIEIVLKMAGIHDKLEIENRINYILEAMGMYNYRMRRASALSGGQQQRVAIARALAKNPEIIIADEPTGNLDSKNTIDIMNIIKKISETKLVILVTHEKDIANFYADRIIKLSDGKIVDDIENNASGDLAVAQDQIIYLKDLNVEEVSTGDINLTAYNDTEGDKLKNIDVKLILRNNTLYIKIDSDEIKRVKYLDKDSEIKLIDDHYKAIKKEDAQNIDFDYSTFKKDVHKSKSRSVITFKDSLKYAFRKLDNLSRGGKFLYFVFAIVGALVSLSIGLFGQVYKIDESQFLQTARNYLYIEAPDMTYQEYTSLLEQPHIDALNLLSNKTYIHFSTTPYYQINGGETSSAHISSIDLVDSSDLILGRMPENDYEILVDSLLADNLMKSLNSRGINDYEDLLNSYAYVNLMNMYYDDYSQGANVYFSIVGITDDESPTIWASDTFYYSNLFSTNYEANIMDYNVIDNFELTSGRMPENKNEVILYGSQSTGIISVDFYGTTLDVVGYYQSDEDTEYYGYSSLVMSSPEYIDEIMFDYLKEYQEGFLVYSNNKAQTTSYFTDLGINVVDNYEASKASYREDALVNSAGILTFAFVGLIISCISFYLIIRSSLISRIYEVSVYRALGATKNDIRKMFIIEIILITTISSIIGYILISILLIRLQNQISTFLEIIYLPIYNIVLGAIGIYIINILSGLLPVNLLIRKTPSEILSQYDL